MNFSYQKEIKIFTTVISDIKLMNTFYFLYNILYFLSLFSTLSLHLCDFLNKKGYHLKTKYEHKRQCKNLKTWLDTHLFGILPACV